MPPLTRNIFSCLVRKAKVEYLTKNIQEYGVATLSKWLIVYLNSVLWLVSGEFKVLFICGFVVVEIELLAVS